MELNLGQWVVIGICALLIFGYIRGYFYNRQLAGRISTWLVEGLKPWGAVVPGEKLPNMATGGRLEIQQAFPPFRRVEAVYLLAPRENPLFWIFYRIQGKHDELMVWINFQSKPDQSIEVARKGDPQFASRMNASEKPGLTLLEPTHPGLQIAIEVKDGAWAAEKTQSFLHEYHRAVRRLSLRPNKPHLFLRADLQILQAYSAVEFFTALSKLQK